MQGKHPAINADHLPVSAAAALIGVSADTLKRWEKAGRIASLRLPNGHRRFARTDVEALLTAAQSA